MQMIMRSFRDETTAHGREYSVIAFSVAVAVIVGLLQLTHAL